MNLDTVGVLGSGTMGHGIAQVAAQAGHRTILYDVALELSQKGIARIQGNLDAGIQKGKVKSEERDATMARLSPTADLKELAGCGLVIEAVPEDLALKQTLFKQLSQICSKDCVLASNTSSLSLTEIAAAAERPERVVGMHFFNPVHI